MIANITKIVGTNNLFTIYKENSQQTFTLGYELSSNHTYNYILGNIRMKTIIFKKIGQYTNSY